MNQTPDPAPTSAPAAAPAPRRAGPPRWIGLAFVGLLMLVLVVSQFLSRRGAEIQWIRNDFPRALAEAKASNRRIFLLLHEPNDPVTASHDRNLFQMHYARDRLAQFVCCRVELAPADPLRQRFHFRSEPLMFLLDSDGNPLIPPLDGPVEEGEFLGQIRPR